MTPQQIGHELDVQAQRRMFRRLLQQRRWSVPYWLQVVGWVFLADACLCFVAWLAIDGITR